MSEPLYPTQPGGPPAPGYLPPPGPVSYPPAYPPAASADPTATTAVPAEPVSAPPPGPGLDRRGRVRTTRSGALWFGLIAAAIILIALLIFVLQNLESVTVHYLGFHGRVPVGVALLLAAVAGLLLVSIPGSVRILQLRRAVRKSSPSR
jgi:uncharacterized integral membrane protein